jgi:hypothetical protein
MGKAPQWPESSQRARLRYANRFLEFLVATDGAKMMEMT